MAKYVVQRYKRYPIYEPAEGGYYYCGKERDESGKSIICETREEATSALRKLVEEENAGMSEKDEGFLVYGENSKGAWANSKNHRYVGDGYEYYVEPINRRGQNCQGKIPYC